MILSKLLVIALWLLGHSISHATELVNIVRESKAEYFLCVDGGGTHTSFSLLDKKGQLIELGYIGASAATTLKLPPSNVTLVGPSGVRNLFENLFRNCQIKIDEKWISLTTILDKCFIYAGFAGAGTLEIQENVASAIRDTRPLRSAKLTYVTSDITLFKNVAPQGIFLNAGTGSIGFWKFNGKEGRAGGDHWLLRSDKGSTVYIGQLAIEKALEIERGHLQPINTVVFSEAEQTNFKNAVLNYKAYKSLSASTVMHLSRSILADLKLMKVERLTCLTPLVFELAYKHNNSIARHILQKAARSLKKIMDQCLWDIQQVQHRSLFLPISIYLSGGLFKNMHIDLFIKEIGLDESQFRILNFSKKNVAVEGIRTAIRDAFFDS